MLYVLIIFVITGHGAAVTTAEFNGESSCNYAAQQVNSMSTSFRGICIKKSQ